MEEVVILLQEIHGLLESLLSVGILAGGAAFGYIIIRLFVDER